MKTGAKMEKSAGESPAATATRIPELDATQKRVIATLASTQEFWQTPAIYDPLHHYDSEGTRYDAGAALRMRVPLESHAEWKSAANRPSGAIDGRDHFVRQMKNMKASMPMEWLTGEPFYFWPAVCAALLARAHCRMGNAAKLAGYCGKSDGLDEALAEFAEAYGDQTEIDHAGLLAAIKKGRVKAVQGI